MAPDRRKPGFPTRARVSGRSSRARYVWPPRGCHARALHGVVMAGRALEAVLRHGFVGALLVPRLGHVVDRGTPRADMRAGECAGRRALAGRAGVRRGRLRDRPRSLEPAAVRADIFVGRRRFLPCSSWRGTRRRPARWSARSGAAREIGLARIDVLLRPLRVRLDVEIEHLTGYGDRDAGVRDVHDPADAALDRRAGQDHPLSDRCNSSR